MSLAPALTKLDRKVLNAVPRITSARRRTVYDGLTSRMDRWARPPEAEVERILRGLAHLEYVTNDYGWWRRTQAGQDLLETP